MFRHLQAAEGYPPLAGSTASRRLPVAQLLRWPVDANERLVLVIGTPEDADSYVRSSKTRLQVVSVLSDDDTGTFYLNNERIDTIQEPEAVLAEVLQRHPIDEVFIGSSLSGVSAMTLALACAERGIIVRTVVKLPVLHFAEYRARVLSQGNYLLSLETVPHSRFPLLIKRALDIVGSIVGLTACALVYCLYARRITTESGADVFFRQQRVGTNGRVFTLYKFRTMYANAEQRLTELQHCNEMTGCIFKMRNDPRVTPIGRRLRRHYLDELPQFFNVLRGDMSLVGPRPPTLDEVARYLPRQRRRLSMKGGLAGLWQLSGNGEIKDFDKIVSLDCEYIDNWSLWLDMKIIARTVFKTIRGDGW